MLGFLGLAIDIAVLYWFVREPGGPASWRATTGGGVPQGASSPNNPSSPLFANDDMSPSLHLEESPLSSPLDDLSSSRKLWEHDDALTRSGAMEGNNPATGLPMMGSGFDVGGNPYGFGSDDTLKSGIDSGSNTDNDWHSSTFDSDIGSSSSSWDDLR